MSRTSSGRRHSRASPPTPVPMARPFWPRPPPSPSARVSPATASRTPTARSRTSSLRKSKPRRSWCSTEQTERTNLLVERWARDRRPRWAFDTKLLPRLDSLHAPRPDGRKPLERIRHEDRRHRHLLGEAAPRIRVEDILCRSALHGYHPRAHGGWRAVCLGRELPALYTGVLRGTHRRHLPHGTGAPGASHHWPGPRLGS